MPKGRAHLGLPSRTYAAEARQIPSAFRARTAAYISAPRRNLVRLPIRRPVPGPAYGRPDDFDGGCVGLFTRTSFEGLEAFRSGARFFCLSGRGFAPDEGEPERAERH